MLVESTREMRLAGRYAGVTTIAVFTMVIRVAAASALFAVVRAQWGGS